MSPLSIWIAFAILFIIIEILTVTFYGLSLALACAIVAVTVYMTHATTFTILQGVIFVISSLFFAFLLPRFLVSDEPDTPQGVDKYIGQIRSVRKVG